MDLKESITLAKGHKHAMVLDASPYDKQDMFGRRIEDLYVMDTADRKAHQSRARARIRNGRKPRRPLRALLPGRSFLDLRHRDRRSRRHQQEASPLRSGITISIIP